MNEIQRILIRISFFLGIILILIGIAILFLGIRKNLGALLDGLGMLFLVPQFYFPVRYEEQRKNTVDYLGRKRYVGTAMIGVFLVFIALFYKS
ncbi:MAG: hypothetical protein LBU99_02980 [Spirochaetaceae bacterium]|jgi:uncharacterized membrane protein|nr:hypothetical protein [Spirochaetaceae bacterium]